MSMGRSLRSSAQHVSGSVRQRIEQGDERVWRLADFRDMPFAAVAQALSRLTRSGALERLSKGTYYRPRMTRFGRSRPNPVLIRSLATIGKPVFPAGIAAANLLGFTTQTGSRPELSTTALSLPRKLAGADTIIHTRRPAAWNGLSQEDGALLEFLRSAGDTSELSPEKTIQRTLRLLVEEGRFERLAGVAASEPPRVRALLGALGEQLGKSTEAVQPFRESLNPFSKFDFGAFCGIKSASNWQARKGPKR